MNEVRRTAPVGEVRRTAPVGEVRRTAPVEEVRRTALANFLRTRRAGLTPQEVGLAPGLRRRAPGLRREEVALLSGVGITWYTWLEQGRDINPSPEVLAAIARTLRLDDAATGYLFRMAGQQPPEGPAGSGDVSGHLLDLIHAQDPAPAVIMDGCWDLRAWNAAADALYRYSDQSPEDRNVAWLMFASPDIRVFTVGWEHHARRMLGELRESFARRPDERMARLLARLRGRFPEADAWLDEREVSRRAGGITKEIRHPEAGTLLLNQIVLHPAEAPDLQVVILQPLAGTPTDLRLAGLAAPRSRR
ncbi:helix-turn-helix domain-containing protein [Planomonospora sp. ID67723]|uniref:helix-turn-helix transcriptional regulator n=1 Tax=Planomonospora sp. ID67723 TaxID=2738134 RepID=UPI0018C43F51|nr:helix-turn-helix transcriptional regulator [Planomonospora sp. ID67723]MBG0830213.1 helix-turn-helix domain-containing protein [Planomonospora sp. ID67723]